MDLTSVSYNVFVPKPLILLLHAIDIIGYTISAILYYLGLYPSFELFPTPWDDRDYIFGSAQHSSSPPPPPQIVSSFIKSRLPVVEYSANFKVDRAVCAVCLCKLRTKDEVRELRNCDHAFHKFCIDRWIDIGKITCPLCRLGLLPAKGDFGQLLGIMKKLR